MRKGKKEVKKELSFSDSEFSKVDKPSYITLSLAGTPQGRQESQEEKKLSYYEPSFLKVVP